SPVCRATFCASAPETRRVGSAILERREQPDRDFYQAPCSSLPWLRLSFLCCRGDRSVLRPTGSDRLPPERLRQPDRPLAAAEPERRVGLEGQRGRKFLPNQENRFVELR